MSTPEEGRPPRTPHDGADDWGRGLPQLARAAALATGREVAVIAVERDAGRRVVAAHGVAPDVAQASVASLLDDVPAQGVALVTGLAGTDLHAIVATPINSSAGVLGALFVADRSERGEDPDPASVQELLVALAVAAGSELELRRDVARAMEREGRAEAELDQKDRLTSRLSHDLRTPMTAILGFGELLKLEALSDEGRESLDHVLSSGRRLLLMIDEVLDLNRLDRGEGEVELEPVAVRDLVRVATLAQGSQATGRGLQLVVDATCSGVARADKPRLQRVLINLLGTVAERAREGTTIHLAGGVSPDGDVQLVIGPEATAALADRVFQPDDPNSDKRLGLTLARRLLSTMGGDAGMVGPAGASGAPTFWVRVPPAQPGEEPSISVAADLPRASPPVPAQVATEAGTHAAKPPEQARAVRRLLYVEDDPANQRLMAKMFADHEDIDVDAALDGGTGLQKAGHQRPDIVLLDLGLPDIPGREVLRRLKEQALTATVPVVVLSGEAEAERPTELRAAGAAAYVAKPFNVRQLVDLVTGLLDHGEAAT